jgi:long-chain acyl-CoA synthetase
MQTLPEVIQHSIEEYHSHPALLWNGNQVTYGDFGEAVVRLANSFKGLGLGKGDRIMVMLPNIPQFPIVYYATMLIGGVVIPINILLKYREIASLLEDSEAKAIISWNGFASEVLKAAEGLEALKHVIFLGDQRYENAKDLTELISSGSNHEFHVEIGEGDVALMIYTSGVTGRPKGVEITHHAIVYHLKEMQDIFRFSSSDKFLAVHPFFQPIAQAMIMNVGLASGTSLILQPRFHPGDVLNAIQNEKITVFLGVPSMYQLITNFPSVEKFEVSSLKYAISGGSNFPNELMQQFEHIFKIPVLEGYGLSESYSFVTVNKMNPGPRIGSVGLPIHGVEVKIFNDDDHEVGVDEVGEIAVRGPTIMKGYLNRPEATRIALRDGWLHTGDLGRLDFEGYLYMVDRKNDVIIKSGFKIYPREIEAVLEGLPHIQEVAVIGIPDEVMGQEIKACVVLKPGAQITSGEIQEYCKEKMAPYKSPKMVRFYRELPKTPTGKILKEELKAN